MIGDVPSDMPTLVCSDAADLDDGLDVGVSGREDYGVGANGQDPTISGQSQPWSLKYLFCGVDEEDEDEGASICGPSLRMRKRRVSPPPSSPPLPPPPQPLGKEFGRR